MSFYSQDPSAVEGGGGSAPLPPGYEYKDASVRVMEAAQEIQRLKASHAMERAELERDARYTRYSAARWSHYVTGASCTALFSKQDGFVALTSPGQTGEQAYLTFWGPNVPKPAEVKRVRMTLAQTGEAPQTVMALNTANPKEPFGSITMAVPTIDALLDNILDVHSFTVTLDGKVVSQVEWTDGFAARDKLRACVARKPGR